MLFPALPYRLGVAPAEEMAAPPLPNSCAGLSMTAKILTTIPDEFNLTSLLDEFMSSDFLPDEEPEVMRPDSFCSAHTASWDGEEQGEMLLLQIPTDDPADIPAYLLPLAAGMTARR